MNRVMSNGTVKNIAGKKVLMRNTISDLLLRAKANLIKNEGKGRHFNCIDYVKLNGWVSSIRRHKNVVFAEIVDGSVLSNQSSFASESAQIVIVPPSKANQ